MENLYFKMKGNAFENGYQLDKMISGLGGTQQVLEGVYKGVTGKSRLSKADRELYKLKAYNVRQSCLLVELGAVFSGIQQTLPFLPSLSPDEMWAYTKESAKFLFETYTSAHAGNKISIHQEEGNVSVIHEGNENITHIYKGPVYQIGTQIITGLRSLDNTLEEDNVTNIELGSKFEQSPAVSMSFQEKGLYQAPVIIDTEPKILCCDIYDFNKYDKVGKLKVSSNQAIIKGKYKFKVVGSQDVEEYILSMTETEIKANCLIEYEHDPLKSTKISTILITDIIGQ